MIQLTVTRLGYRSLQEIETFDGFHQFFLFVIQRTDPVAALVMVTDYRKRRSGSNSVHEMMWLNDLVTWFRLPSARSRREFPRS